MFREARAVWKGGPYAGEGAVTTPTGVLNNTTYVFGSLADTARFTSPSEMLAAAMASCMSTMVAVEMAKVGIKPIVVETYVVLTVDNPQGYYRIQKAESRDHRAHYRSGVGKVRPSRGNSSSRVSHLQCAEAGDDLQGEAGFVDYSGDGLKTARRRRLDALG